MIWRDDREESQPKERPTTTFFVQCAIDSIREQENFVLEIRHVIHHQGKGFVPTCAYIGGASANGEVVLGEDLQAYDEAMRAGEELLMKKIADHKTDMERIIGS